MEGIDLKYVVHSCIGLCIGLYIVSRLGRCSVFLNHFLIVFLLFPPAVNAAPRTQYLLPKIGMMQLDINKAQALSSFGVLYGYEITQSLTFETELNLGISGGNYDTTSASGNRSQGEYSIRNLAGYGVYRHLLGKSIYLKAKAGLLYEQIKRHGVLTPATGNSQADNENSSGFGIAGGAGVGLVLNNGVIKNTIVELEITGIDEDIVFYSIGFNYSFN